jgi:LPS export ABC transporter protein LptC
MTIRIATLALLALTGTLAACQPEATLPAQSTGDLPADQIVYGLRHAMTQEGIRKAVLQSDSAYVVDDGRRFDLHSVNLEFFDETGRRAGELTSIEGEYATATGLFVARGTVVLVTTGPQGNRRLETEELHYDPNADQIWSPVPFVMREGGQTSRGQSFRSDTQFRNFTIQGARGAIPSGELTF